MDLTSTVVGGAILLIFIAAIIIAILRWWEESDGFTQAFVVFGIIVIVGALAIIFWQVTLTVIGIGAILACGIYVVTH